MVTSELTGEVNRGVISISSVLETGPLYRVGPTRRYTEKEDQSFWTFLTSDLFFLLISGLLV